MVVGKFDFLLTHYKQHTGLQVEGPVVLQYEKFDLPTPASIVELWPDYLPSTIVY